MRENCQEIVKLVVQISFLILIYYKAEGREHVNSKWFMFDCNTVPRDKEHDRLLNNNTIFCLSTNCVKH